MWQRIWDLLEPWLYAPSAQASGAGGALRRGLRYPLAVLRDLSRGELNLRAMGLVYATLLAIIPAVALSFLILRSLGLEHDLQPLLYEFFRPVGAGAGQMTERVMRFAESVRAGLVGSIGLALLVWTLLGTVRRVEDSFNFVWRVRSPRPFARRMADGVGLLVIGPVVIVSVVAFSKLALDNAVGALGALPQLSRLAVRIAPYGIVTLVFTALYWVLPNARVKLWPALCGAICAGVLWAAIGQLFTAMVIYTSRLTLIYAGFAVIGAVLLWTYLGWTILLVGAQLAFYLQHPAYLRIGQAALTLGNREKEGLALSLLCLLARQPGIATRESLGHALGLPGVAIEDLVGPLWQAGLVGREGETLRLLVAPEQLRLVTALQAIRAASGPPRLHARPLALVLSLQQVLQQGWEVQLGDRSLRDLLEGRC